VIKWPLLAYVRNYTKQNYEYHNQSTDLKFLIILYQHVFKQILRTTWRLAHEDNSLERNYQAIHLPMVAHLIALHSIFFSFFFSMVLPAHSGPRPPIQFRNPFSQKVGLLGQVISSSQGLYLNTGQHKQNKRIHTPNIHALSGIRTHDPSVRASEDSSCLRPVVLNLCETAAR
jgi:hypothetical protein